MIYQPGKHTIGAALMFSAAVAIVMCGEEVRDGPGRSNNHWLSSGVERVQMVSERSIRGTGERADIVAGRSVRELWSKTTCARTLGGRGGLARGRA